MFRYFKKDNLWLGLAIGIVVPAATYGILYLLNSVFTNSQTGHEIFRQSTLQIVSIIPSAILLRYYLVKLKADKTGRGILFITFVIAIAIFITQLR